VNAAGRLTFEPVDDAITVFDGGWLVPGLVGAHAPFPCSARPATARSSSTGQGPARAQLEAGVLLAASGALLTPTLLIADGIVGAIKAFGGDDDAAAAMRRALDAQPALVAQGAGRGVSILAGTDAGMGPHGQVATEISLLLKAGLSPEAALAAGSWAARDYLGLPGIEEGAPADLVAYRDDPTADVEALRRPAAVVLDGRLVRR